jgi:hypothetical protein
MAPDVSRARDPCVESIIGYLNAHRVYRNKVSRTHRWE